MLFAQCEIAPSMGIASKVWDDVFTQNGPGRGLEPAGSPGWTGGDSTYSVLLPNGDSAFLFSDSYIAESPAVKGDGTVGVDKDGVRTTAINCGPPICDPEASTFAARNSILVLSKDRKTVKTLVGPKDPNGLSSSYFPIAEKYRHYWVGDAVIFKGKLYVFLLKFDDKLGYHGSAVAQLNAATLKIEKIREIGNPGDPAMHWGSALLLEKQTLYIYGKKVTGGRKQAVVARTDISKGLDALADMRYWTVWNSEEWVHMRPNAASVIPDADSTSDEYSVKKFLVNGRETYIMVGMNTAVPFGTWKDVTLYSSCDPQGPFTGGHKVYETPETTATALPGFTSARKLKGSLVVYNPHIHPQFSGDGKLLISYNLNRRHNSDSIFIDGYRPKFIEVGVKGLK